MAFNLDIFNTNHLVQSLRLILTILVYSQASSTLLADENIRDIFGMVISYTEKVNLTLVLFEEIIAIFA